LITSNLNVSTHIDGAHGDVRRSPIVASLVEAVNDGSGATGSAKWPGVPSRAIHSPVRRGGSDLVETAAGRAAVSPAGRASGSAHQWTVKLARREEGRQASALHLSCHQKVDRGAAQRQNGEGSLEHGQVEKRNQMP